MQQAEDDIQTLGHVVKGLHEALKRERAGEQQRAERLEGQLERQAEEQQERFS